jgi:hypothetical protein
MTRDRDTTKDAMGWVYFVGNDDWEPTRVKIGRTKNLVNRVKAINSMQCEAQLFLMAGILANDRIQMERECHGRAATYRLHGEWFTGCAEIRQLWNDLGHLHITYHDVIGWDPDLAIPAEQLSRREEGDMVSAILWSADRTQLHTDAAGKFQHEWRHDTEDCVICYAMHGDDYEDDDED